MPQTRDSYKAGLFVIAAIALALLAIFLLADFSQFTQSMQQVRVTFKLRDGIKGLAVGAAVTIGDRPIGTVTAIEEQIETQGEDVGRVTGLWVDFEIPRKGYTLHEDAVIELVVPTLGSGTRLNITHVGGKGPVYAHGTSMPIPGALAGSTLTRDLVRDIGIKDRQREQIADIIDTIHTQLPAIAGKINAALDEAIPMLADAKLALHDVREAASGAKSLVQKIEGEADVWVQRIDRVTDNMDAITTDARVVIEAAGPDAQASLENIRAATERVRASLAANLPIVSRVIANLQLTAEQLKLVSIEVRRSPWRLLYKPDKVELASDNVYDAARSFALGASALESTSASLRALAEQEPDRREQITAMLDYLDGVFARFQQVEASLWEQTGQGKP